MKKLTLTLGFILPLLAAFSQEKKLELSSERKSDKSVEISYLKTDPGYYTVVLNFTELSNTSEQRGAHSINGLSGRLLTLKPANGNEHIGYRYSYQSIRGKLNPKINRDFCYLLPYVAGTPCEVVEAGYASERYFGAQKPADWKSYLMYTEKQEMVTAIRKGMVVDITDVYDEAKGAEFTTRLNSVIIEQADGSLVRYLGFGKGSLKVQVGDEVFPGSQLGLNSQRGAGKFCISIFMYYLNSVDFESLKGQTLSSQKSLYGIITPRFAVADHSCIVLENRKTYISFSSREIVTGEMSKREIKKYADQ